MHNKNSIRLSTRLFYAIILASLGIGLLLTTLQVWLDWRQTHRELSRLAPDTVTLLSYPASEAAYSLDRIMADRVLEGLLSKPFVISASILVDGKPLAEVSRESPLVSQRRFVERLFGSSRDHVLRLERPAPAPSATVGELRLAVDTGIAGSAFIQRAQIAMLNGLLQSIGFGLLLYGIIHALITRPLERLIQSIGTIDPRKAGALPLQAPPGHEHNELGIWVDTCNRLLEAVDEHNRQRRLAEANVARLSNYDPLTELPNRSLLLKELEAATFPEPGRDLVLIYLGLDDFSSVNLLHSYRAGDRLLVLLAQRMRRELPADTLLARVGGDQFCAVLMTPAAEDTVRRIAESLLRVAREPFPFTDQRLLVTATVGIAHYPRDALTPELLLKNAEQVMLLGKSTRSDCVYTYSEMADQRQRAAKQLEKDLQTALAHDQFLLMFQPQINLVNGAIGGVEALLRWQHPSRGRVSPDEFITLAETNRAVIPIGRWVLDTACRALARWRQAGHEGLCLSVNLSTIQLHHPGMLNDLERILTRYRIPPASLTLEITETAVMEDLESSIGILQDIHAMGVKLAVDDFGTGYSSLSYLRRMPIDEVKLDRSFLAEANLQGNGVKIVESIIHLSHTLELEVVAEGTETVEQIELLRACHCDRAQGFLFSEPVTEDQVLALLQGEASLRHILDTGAPSSTAS